MQYQLVEAQSEDLSVALASAWLHTWSKGGGRPSELFSLVRERVPQVHRLVDHRRGSDVALVLRGGCQPCWLGDRDLVWQPGRARKEWSLGVVVVQSDTELESSHLLLVLI